MGFKTRKKYTRKFDYKLKKKNVIPYSIYYFFSVLDLSK